MVLIYLPIQEMQDSGDLEPIQETRVQSLGKEYPLERN